MLVSNFQNVLVAVHIDKYLHIEVDTPLLGLLLILVRIMEARSDRISDPENYQSSHW